MNIQIDNNGTIHIEQERYIPWPNFGHRGVKTLRGVWNPKHLKWLLTEEDLFCGAWRRPIPADVLKELRRYPDYHAELMELAQIDPFRFVRLSRLNPAMVLLIATYWVYPKWQRMPNRKKRDAFRQRLLSMEPRETLGALVFPSSQGCVRILQKIPSQHCWIYQVTMVFDLLQDKSIARYLPHLSAITPEVVYLLQQHELPIDMHLLELAAREPYRGIQFLPFVVCSIYLSRQRACREPLWPYKGAIRSWSSLLKIEWENAKRCGDQSLQFPPPPVPINRVPEGLTITPLYAPQLLRAEAMQMNNCSEGYMDSIQRGEHYLYRVDAPQRATVLLKREHSQWEVDEIGLPNNDGEPELRTEWLISKWMRSNNAGHRPEN